VDQFSKLAVNLFIVVLTAVASVAPVSAAVFFFENNSGITIPDPGQVTGQALPYPSTINVSGVTGTVTHMVVQLRMTHTNPEDIGILLVNPNGLRTAVLMSDAGGTPNVQGVTLTFNDCAPRLLPNQSQIVSGTFKPSSYATSGLPFIPFPLPAPPEPYGPGLAEFNGTNAGPGVNGAWSLYVRDAVALNQGSIGFWNITIFTNTAVPGGVNPVPCGKPDFDGDGRADIVVYRDGVWFIARSSDGGSTTIGWGAPGDKPVAADYDGDGLTDAAVYRNGAWFIRRSSDGGLTSIGWGGAPQDEPVPADHDGDGLADVAVYRDGTWWILRSSDGGIITLGWGGAPQDIPIPLSPP
jgi:subtilisin-like proprotein convertase family protein